MEAKVIHVSGAVVFWRTGPSRRDDLKALDRLGLGRYVPEVRTPKAILHDALRSIYADAKTLVRPLAKRAAFTVVSEKRGKDENDYTTKLGVEITDDGLVLTPPDDVEEGRIAEQYALRAGYVSGQAVTQALVGIMQSLSGIPLRPSGGVYWIPSASLDRWAEICGIFEGAAVAAGDTKVYVMRTAKDADAMRAIRDGVIGDLESQAARIAEEISGGQLGERALKSRIEEGQQLLDLLATYEEILDDGLEEVKTKIATVQQAAAEGMIRAAGLAGAASEGVMHAA